MLKLCTHLNAHPFRRKKMGKHCLGLNHDYCSLIMMTCKLFLFIVNLVEPLKRFAQGAKGWQGWHTMPKLSSGLRRGKKPWNDIYNVFHRKIP